MRTDQMHRRMGLIVVGVVVAACVWAFLWRTGQNPDVPPASPAQRLPGAGGSVVRSSGELENAAGPGTDLPHARGFRPSPLSADVAGGKPVAPAAKSEKHPVVERLKRGDIPIQERLKTVDYLASKGDEESVSILMALGDAKAYLNAAAVEALGSTRDVRVPAYLKGKLTHTDPLVIAGAVRALARVEGKKAIPRISKVLKDNRRRPDGFEDVVCNACVEAFSRIQSASAVPVLRIELKETVGRFLQYDYGSRIVAALKHIGDPAGRPVLLAYAERLSVEKGKTKDNPMAQRYFQDKIEEARAAAAVLKTDKQP